MPLLIQWHISRCNVKDCKNKPTTIIKGLIKTPFGLCETHYQEGKKAGKMTHTLEF